MSVDIANAEKIHFDAERIDFMTRPLRRDFTYIISVRHKGINCCRHSDWLTIANDIATRFSDMVLMICWCLCIEILVPLSPVIVDDCQISNRRGDVKQDRFRGSVQICTTR